MPAGLGGMSGLLGANGLGHAALGMGLPSGLAGGKPHGLGSHDGGSSENLLSSESGAWAGTGPCQAAAAWCSGWWCGWRRTRGLLLWWPSCERRRSPRP